MSKLAIIAGTKGKTWIWFVSKVQGKDWWYYCIYKVEAKFPTPKEIATITLPFELKLEQENVIPNEFTCGMQFCNAISMAILWIGYFAIYIDEHIAISNAFKVWFEIKKAKLIWRAVQLPWPELKLKDWPINRIDYDNLQQTSLQIKGQPLTYPSITKDLHSSNQPTYYHLSLTEWGQEGGRCPWGTRDNPFLIEDLKKETPKKKNSD